MTEKKVKQHRTIGSIIKVPLNEDYHTYARILPGTSFAFYDHRTTDEIEDLTKIISSPILFIISVQNYAITRGRWLKIGKIPLEESLLKEPPRFVQDALNPEIFEIVENGNRRKATIEECMGLERLSVWQPAAVEKRLIEHYNGKKSDWLLQIIDPTRRKKNNKNTGRLQEYLKDALEV